MTTPPAEPHDELMLRRGTAFVLELLCLQLLVLPVALVATGDPTLGTVHAPVLGTLHLKLVAPLVLGGAFLLRDVLFGGTSPGKRLVGLRVVHPGADAPPRPFAALLRNVPLVLAGLGWLVEIFAAYRNDDKRRLGDRIADTRVVDVDPGLRTKPWTLIFVTLWIGGGFALRSLQPHIYTWLEGLL